MNRYTLCLIGFLLTSYTLYGQPPGYIGKRNPISLELNSFPAIRFSQLGDGKLPVNVRWGLKFEHVLSRRFSVGLSSSHIFTKSDYEFRRRNRTIIGKARLNGVALGIHAKMYNFKRVGNIAPVGPFQEIEVFYLNYSLKDLNLLFYEDARSNLGRYHDIALSLGLGTQRVFAQNFTYTFGFRVGTALGLFRNPNETEQEQYLHEIAIDRLQGYFFLNAYAGIGFILF